VALFFALSTYVYVGFVRTDRAGGQELKDVRRMAGRSKSEVTSAKAASAASKVLRNPRSSKAAKSAAASALTQRPNRKK
jgi:hypothetical protein